MRFPAPQFVFFLAVAAFHSTLSASLESAEKEEVVAAHDGLIELQKIDQMEFEVALKNEAAHANVTEEQNVDTRYAEAAQNGSVEEHTEAESHSTGGSGDSDLAAHEESQSEYSEEADEQLDAKGETVSSVDEVNQESTEEQDALERERKSSEA